MKISLILLSLMAVYVVSGAEVEDTEELCSYEMPRLEGPPGKKGPKGQKGDVGPAGVKGEVGLTGESGSCSCDVENINTIQEMNEIIQALQQQVNVLNKPTLSVGKKYTLLQTYSNIDNIGMENDWESENYLDINGFTWRVMIQKKSIDSVEYLELMAQCERWDRKTWSFQAQVVLTLLPAISGVEPVTKEFTRTLEEPTRGWGYSQFVKFGSLSNGYITDGGDISVKMDIVPQGIKYGTAREHDVVTITHTFGGVREMVDNEYLYSNTMAYGDNFSFKFKIKRNPAGYLSIYLTCDNPAQTWSLNTGRLIRLISGKNGVHSAQRFSNDRTYTPSSNSWGFSKFILWADLVNDDNGYINDDGEITVEFLVYPHSFSINQD